MNNDIVPNIFTYLKKQQIETNDTLNLNKVYYETTNSIALNKYINRHFGEWTKEYNLDNPRENYYANNLNKRKYELQPTIRGKFKLFFQIIL